MDIIATVPSALPAKANDKGTSFVVHIEYVGGKIEQFAFDHSEIRVGRAEGNDLILDDSFVSRKHAVLSDQGDGTYKLKSLQSQNGIKYNGEKVEEVILKPGDQVVLGKTTFKLLSTSMLSVRDLSSIESHQPKKTVDPLFQYQDATFVALHDDEDEDEEDNLPPVYSMRDQLLNAEPIQSGRNLGWEVIRYREEQVYECKPILEQDSSMEYKDGSPIIVVDNKNHLLIKRDPSIKICIDLKSDEFFPIADALGFDRSGYAKAPSEPFTLEHRGIYFHVRRKSLPELNLSKTALQIESNNVYITGFLAWLHFAIIALVSVLNPQNSPSTNVAVKEDVERFITISVNDVEPQAKPTPPPKIQVPIERDIPKASPTKPTKMVNVTRQNFKVSGQKTAPTGKIPGVTQIGALGKLNGTGLFSKTPNASSPNQLVAAVSNVTAVRAAGGIQTFSMSGNIGWLPGKEVRMARITDINPKVHAGTPQGDGFGAASVGRKTKQKVSGLVVDISPPPIEVSVQGGLSRAEIEKIVAQHVSEIRYCYEKGLLDDPSLNGKITAKWTIDPAGSVSQSGIASSSVQNAGVHGCLVKEIYTWNFPKPRNGGAVLVSFPFVFNSSSF